MAATVKIYPVGRYASDPYGLRTPFRISIPFLQKKKFLETDETYHEKSWPANSLSSRQNSILQLCFMAWYNCSACKKGE
jgi:hypothetical protein